MKKNQHAGMSGKGFYAALTLSAAMVGAACWYAYSEAGKLTPPAAPKHQYTGEASVPQTTAPYTSAQTTASAGTAVTAPPRTSAVTEAVTEAAAEAAALIHRSTETETLPLVPSETEAPAVLPLPPVEGKMLRQFSGGELVKSPTTGIWSTHNGADYDAPRGTDVRCTADGTVTAIGQDALLGICVTILHEDGTVTRYCGLNEGLSVQQGDVIRRGTVIGAVGDTNESENSMVSHLHFEVQQNGKYIDPELFLSGMTGTAQPAETGTEA